MARRSSNDRGRERGPTPRGGRIRGRPSASGRPTSPGSPFLPGRQPLRGRLPIAAPEPKPPIGPLPVESRFFVHVVPGLEEVSAAEIASCIPSARRLATWRALDERTSILELRAPSDLNPLLRLGTIEDLFVLAARGRAVRSDRMGMGQMAAAVRDSRYWESALQVALAGRSRPVRTIRVVARMTGEHGFRRTDAQEAIEQAIRRRLPQARPAAEAADLEFWLSLIGGEMLLGIRLSSPRTRQHGGSPGSLPAALKPAVARAMVLLSEPDPGDVVLDPCCGGATLLIERARAGPADRLIGIDRSPEALGIARSNLQAARATAEIREGSALQLPLPDASVDAILTNPPYGKKWKLEDAREFYAGLLQEMGRVIRPGGRIVLVTSQFDSVRSRLARGDLPLRMTRRLPISLRGEPAAILVIAHRTRRLPGDTPARTFTPRA